MPPRLPELIKRARRLALDRDRLIQELARDWVAALKGRGFSPRDLEELWAGLTEEAVRRLAKQSTQSASAEPRTTIVGSRLGPKAVRKSASRVARPAMSNETTAAEVSAAAVNAVSKA